MFLRRKSKQQQKAPLQSQSPSYPKPLNTTPDVGSPTPLFAKFASLAGTNESGTKPVVSAPMTLAQRSQSGNSIQLGTEAARPTSILKPITVEKPLPPPKSPPSQLSAASYLPPKEPIASNARRISTQTHFAPPATDSATQNKADTAGSSRSPPTRKSSVPAQDLRRRESNANTANGYSYSGQSSVNVFNGNGQDTYGREQTYRATNSNNIPSSSLNSNNFPPSSFSPTPSAPSNGLPYAYVNYNNSVNSFYNISPNMGASQSSLAPNQFNTSAKIQPQLMPQYINSPPLDQGSGRNLAGIGGFGGNLAGIGRKNSVAAGGQGAPNAGFGGARKGPLIFTAQQAVQPPSQPPQQERSSVSNPRMTMSAASSYPSPPAEYISSFSPPTAASAPMKRQSVAAHSVIAQSMSPDTPNRRLSMTTGPSAFPTSPEIQNRRLSTANTKNGTNTMKAQPPLPPPSSQSPPPARAVSQSHSTKRRSVLQKNPTNGHAPVPLSSHQEGNVRRNGHAPFENGFGVPIPMQQNQALPHSPPPSQTPHGSHRTLTKSRPKTPPKHMQQQDQTPSLATPPVSPERLHKQSHPPLRPMTDTSITSQASTALVTQLPSSTHRSSTVISNAEFEEGKRVSIPLDVDPFAKSEGVKVLPPSRDGPPVPPKLEPMSSVSSSSLPLPGDAVENTVDEPSGEDEGSNIPTNVSPPLAVPDEPSQSLIQTQDPLTPLPEHSRIPRKRERLDQPLEPLLDPLPLKHFPLIPFLSNAALLRCLLGYLTYWDWCQLFSVSWGVRIIFGVKFLNFEQSPSGINEELKEEVLERFFRTVGYVRWGSEDGENEPLSLSLADLHSYLFGVSLPAFEYARVAGMLLNQRNFIPSLRDPTISEKAKMMLMGTRSYNRLVLRLRAWAERESNYLMAPPVPNSSVGNGVYGSPRSPPNASRSSSRAPSPNSSFTHGYGPRSTNGHGTQGYGTVTPPAPQGFRSPLFRTNRAPLLRVFVPSPEGDWLSDASVLECEEELKRAGLVGVGTGKATKGKATSNMKGLMRMGDVVWDMAVGEEGNAGRMIWDGSYLIDLDYTYSPIGDLPRYIPGFAFPPSYFHRIIRTAASSTSSANPILRLDISPWGAEVASNLQLLQDRVRTETPQGSFHNVVRWVHRSSFHLRPPQSSRSQSHGRTSVRVSNAGDHGVLDPRIPIPSASPTGVPLFVDPGWYGKVVVETEGTNEALADLQNRCGSGAFPPRATPNTTIGNKEDGKLVWRVLRERSRPGEVWIRTVSIKERLM